MNCLRFAIWASLLLAGTGFAWAATDNLRYRETAERHSLRLENDFAMLQKSAEARQRITEDVIAGHLTLLQAARRFCAVGAGNRPWVLRQVLDSFPGQSDDERASYWVIRSVKTTVEIAPNSQRSVLIEGLESQLRDLASPSQEG
jgi:hypothetical protein